MQIQHKIVNQNSMCLIADGLLLGGATVNFDMLCNFE